MEELKAKIFLKQIQKINLMIMNKKQEIIQWKSVATNITSKSDCERVQSSGSKEKVADAVVNYVDLEKEIAKEINELYKKKKVIYSVIEQLSVEEYDLLYKVYVNGMSLEDVAYQKNKSTSWANSIHGIALRHVQIILNEIPEEEKCNYL